MANSKKYGQSDQESTSEETSVTPDTPSIESSEPAPAIEAPIVPAPAPEAPIAPPVTAQAQLQETAVKATGETASPSRMSRFGFRRIGEGRTRTFRFAALVDATKTKPVTAVCIKHAYNLSDDSLLTREDFLAKRDEWLAATPS